MLETIAQDLRHAFRTFGKHRAFTAAAVLILALGIGATSSIFSVAHGVLLRPLPYEEPDRLVRIWPETPMNKRALLALEQEVTGLEHVSGFGTWSIPITEGGEPEAVSVGRVSAGHFSVLGRQAFLGHTFREQHHLPGEASLVTILSHRIWQRRFGGTEDVLGRRLEINGRDHTIIGVMPRDHRALDPRWQLWTPLVIDTGHAEDLDSSYYLGLVARLRPGVSAQQAEAQVRSAAWTLVERHGQRFTREQAEAARVVPLHSHLVGAVRPTLLLLLGAVGVILLVTCANVANLLLSRAAGRQREMAVRSALGADRRRLLRQLLVESLALAAAGGAVGWLIALWAFDLLRAQLPADLPRLEALAFDGPVLLFCLAATMASALLFGAAPALSLAGGDLRSALAGGHGNGGSSGRLAGAFVIFQVAACAALLVTALLLLESMASLRATDPGFDAEHVLSLRPVLSPSHYDSERAAAFYDEAFTRLRGLPAVSQVGAIQLLPMSEQNWHFPFSYEGWAPDPSQPQGTSLPMANFRAITPGYLEALGVPLHRGRGLDTGDRADGRRVGLINRTLAEQLWPGQDAVGRRLSLFGDKNHQFTVVGVVGDVRQAGLREAPKPEIYWTLAQSKEFGIRSMAILVRSVGPPSGIAAEVRGVLRAIDPRAPITEMTTLPELLEAQVAEPRLTALIASSFALLALVLGMAGVYGVISCNVAGRLPEISLRMALGAARHKVMVEVLSGGLKLVAAGLVAGLLTAAAVAHVLRHTLHTAQPASASAAALAAAAIVLAAVAALWIPARRASRVDPASALRHD